MSRGRSILIFLLCISFVSCINRKCFEDDQCPNNSYCSPSTKYCICQTGYILDCDTEAFSLTQSLQQYNITINPIYFLTLPTELDTYYWFLYTICSDDIITNFNLSLAAWLDVGQDELSTQKNYIGNDSINATLLGESDICYEILTPNIKFEDQRNGNKQGLIIQLKLVPLSSGADSDTQFHVKMSSEEVKVVDSNLLLVLAIVIICVVLIGLIITAVWCIWKRWRRNSLRALNMDYKKKMIDHLKEEMPETQFNKIKSPSSSNCTICLGQFESSQKVRNLVCGHLFHSTCIDAWCLKNLNCPVCRFQLDEASIQLKKRQKQSRSSQSNNISYQLNQISERTYSNRQTMRSVRQNLLEQNPINNENL